MTYIWLCNRSLLDSLYMYIWGNFFFFFFYQTRCTHTCAKLSLNLLGPLHHTQSLKVVKKRPPTPSERGSTMALSQAAAATAAGGALIKKKRKFSSDIRKFRMDQLQSHIWLTASSYRVKYLRISSYIGNPFLIYDFSTAPFWISLYMGKNFFVSDQCEIKLDSTQR